MTTAQTSTRQFLSNDKVFTLCDMASAHLNDILDELGIRYKSTPKLAYFACPIHGGDNPSAVNIYRDGYSVKGFWRCNTQHCENKWGKNLVGFVRGTLSAQAKKDATFREAVNFICDVLGTKFEDIKIDKQYLDQQKFVKNQYVNRKVVIQGGIHRSEVRKRLEIPSELYIQKGFDRQILDDYDVGLCKLPGKEMSNRVVFPVYDEENRLVGCVGRSIFNPCSSCGYYHGETECPSKNVGFSEYTKWRNSSNFNTGRNFFNFFHAKPFVDKLSSVIIVEGQTDVLKLEMAGIHNSFGIFGDDLTDDQQILLEGSGALSIVIALDSDEAGKKGQENIIKKLNKYYRLFPIELKSHDIGDMSVEEIKDTLLPTIEKSYRRF